MAILSFSLKSCTILIDEAGEYSLFVLWKAFLWKVGKKFYQPTIEVKATWPGVFSVGEVETSDSMFSMLIGWVSLSGFFFFFLFLVSFGGLFYPRNLSFSSLFKFIGIVIYCILLPSKFLPHP